MNRRKFLAGALTTAAGLLLPHQPERIYSFPSKRFLRLNRVELVSLEYYGTADDGSGYYDTVALIHHDGNMTPHNLFMATPVDDPRMKTQLSHDLLKQAYLDHHEELVERTWHENNKLWTCKHDA